VKVAFDATVLQSRKSGVGYYCQELLKALVTQDHETEFFVFSHQPLDLRLADCNGNVELSQSRFCSVRAVYLHGLLPGLLDTARPDLCHYTNFLAPMSEHRPYVVTIHDMGLESLRHAHPLAKRTYTKRLIPHVAKKARLILTNSEFSKWEIVRHLGVCEDRIRVTPLAASPEFKPVPPTRQRPYFLYVGNIEPRKNLARLLEAFATLPNKNHELVIVGNRWYKGGAAEARAYSLGIGDRVRFLGYVPREDLPALYSGATAFVYPSLLEGFGLPVVEAMACGAPVITSNSSSLKEVAEGGAVLVDPLDVSRIAEAMAMVSEDEKLRKDLSTRALRRSSEFAWERTAQLTLEAYRDAIGIAKGTARGVVHSGNGFRKTFSDRGATRADTAPAGRHSTELQAAIRKTISYSQLFQYPLTRDEVRERLFGISVDQNTFDRTWESLQLDFDGTLLQLRSQREAISDQAIREAQPHLRTLASIPFVRMIAFSGGTAHRNMSTNEDLDLFIIVEDGKLWTVFLIAMVWAKLKGLRKRLCMNYLLSDAALPLFETDLFTAQQMASLKPIFGKDVYDRFLQMNPFVRRHFPNFDPSRHRNAYSEISRSRFKRVAECLMRFGPAQLLERASRQILRPYLRRKVRLATLEGTCEALLEPRRLKLHLMSHKKDVLSQFQDDAT
jgi:glycosyltransferase involved in cell wall biosynthesis